MILSARFIFFKNEYMKELWHISAMQYHSLKYIILLFSLNILLSNYGMEWEGKMNMLNERIILENKIYTLILII